jgi:hypothetical protein
MDATAILQPVLVMALLTTAMAVWMYATRIPAMQKAGIEPNDARDKGALATLPASARWPADNYNHLFEQPTLFYAVALAVRPGRALRAARREASSAPCPGSFLRVRGDAKPALRRVGLRSSLGPSSRSPCSSRPSRRTRPHPPPMKPRTRWSAS